MWKLFGHICFVGKFFFPDFQVTTILGRSHDWNRKKLSLCTSDYREGWITVLSPIWKKVRSLYVQGFFLLMHGLGVRKKSDNFLNAIQMFTRIHFTNLVAHILGNNLWQNAIHKHPLPTTPDLSRVSHLNNSLLLQAIWPRKVNYKHLILEIPPPLTPYHLSLTPPSSHPHLSGQSRTLSWE